MKWIWVWAHAHYPTMFPVFYSNIVFKTYLLAIVCNPSHISQIKVRSADNYVTENYVIEKCKMFLDAELREFLIAFRKFQHGNNSP